MARPSKTGLNYFPMDVDIFGDIKMRVVMAKFGAQGIALYLYLLTRIYEHGFFVEADEDLLLFASLDLQLHRYQVAQMLDLFLERELLDGELYREKGVLTSRSIQRRYQEAVKTRGSKRRIAAEASYWLLEPDETASFIRLVSEEESENTGEKSDNPWEESDNCREESDNFREESDILRESLPNGEEKPVKIPEKPSPSCFSGNNGDKSENNPDLWQNNAPKKSKEKKNRVKERREEPPAANAPETDAAATRTRLEQQYGRKLTEAYIAKAACYHHKGDAAVFAAAQWLTTDELAGRIKPQPERPVSFDLDAYTDMVRRYRPRFKPRDES